MSAETLVSMRDARDAEDARLLEAGDHETLLATYFDTVVDRCFAILRDLDAANEVAQRVFERLWRELVSGKRYPVPFRVVVHNVVGWTVKAFRIGLPREAELPESLPDEGADPVGEWIVQEDLAEVIAIFPPRQRQVAHLHYLLGLEIAEIAERLGLERNAVDQALHNARQKLVEALGG